MWGSQHFFDELRISMPISIQWLSKKRIPAALELVSGFLYVEKNWATESIDGNSAIFCLITQVSEFILGNPIGYHHYSYSNRIVNVSN
jgi:hypothetical protein